MITIFCYFCIRQIILHNCPIFIFRSNQMTCLFPTFFGSFEYLLQSRYSIPDFMARSQKKNIDLISENLKSQTISYRTEKTDTKDFLSNKGKKVHQSLQPKIFFRTNEGSYEKVNQLKPRHQSFTR